MQQKPTRWNIAPALVAPESRRLWRGLAFIAPMWGHAGKGALLGPHGGPLADTNLVAGSTLQWRGTPYGLGAGISGDSNLLFQDNFEPIKTSDGAGTGDFTLLMLANPIAEARLSMGLSQGQSANVENLWLGFNNAVDGILNASSGTFNVGTRTASVMTNAAVAGAIDGRYHLFGGRRAGMTVSAFVDGVNRASTANTVRDIATGALGFAIGNRAQTTLYRIDAACNVVIAMGWNRALSDAEMRLLARDVFCMFRPMPEWRGVWTPLSGGNAVLSPADLTDSLVFETPAISQSHSLTASDAFFAGSFEMPALSTGAILSPAKSVFAASFETAGILQAHLFSAQEINLAFAFEFAALAMGAQSTPDFRTIGIANNLRRKKADGDARNAPVVATNRTRSITE